MNPSDHPQKSTVEEIRARFDADVERFSDLDTGQSATMDAPLVLELISRAAVAITPNARSVLDIGCGAGNYMVKMLPKLEDPDVTLLDLSKPMLQRAFERTSTLTRGSVVTRQEDIRESELEPKSLDIIVAAAVFHHLRDEEEWEAVYRKLYTALKPGGALWVSDLITHENPAINEVMWEEYGRYLTGLKDEAYRDQVFSYIQVEDTPRPLGYQLELLRSVGFSKVEVLHKTAVFAAYGALV